MSSEDTENTLRMKLMELLEEELSALKLGSVKNEDKNESLYIELSGEKEEVGKKEEVSSSSDNTAGVENRDQNEVKCKPIDVVLSTENAAGSDTQHQTNYQRQAIEYVRKEETFIPVTEKEAEKIMKPKFKRGGQECISDMETFSIPPETLSEKILYRVESYFEDYNIFKNSFLLNHVRRNKKGFISLKLVSSLRKIKTLTRDFRVVAFSLRKSKILELNPECNKVRRIEPVPKIEDTSFGKTVMIFNLPQKNLSRDSLRELFSKFGTVVSVDVFDISSPECDPYHERCLYFHRKIASRIYGIVEFENYEEVVNALKDDEGHLPKENEMKVVPLMPQIYKKERRHLTFLDLHDTCPRGGYRRGGRFKPRDESHVTQNEIAPPSEDVPKNGKLNMGGNRYSRGNFRRPYRGRRYYVPPTVNKYSDGHYYGDYNGMKNNKWNESRQLRANNSFNIDRFYPNMYRKKPANGFTENGVSV